MPHQISQDVRQCIQDCDACANVCTEAVDHCLQLGGRHAAADHIRLLLDCAAICQMSADYMLRSSDFMRRVCGVCAEVDERCAQSCDQLADDPLMRMCADACRRAAASCRRMAGMRAAA